jgi:hypothetical protein
MLRGNVLAVDDNQPFELRAYAGPELGDIGDQARAHGTTTSHALAILGERTFDIYLNDRAYWRNVPERVWRYTRGGEPLLESWLRDRRASSIGRALTRDELLHFGHMARRIGQLLMLLRSVKSGAMAAALHLRTAGS